MWRRAPRAAAAAAACGQRKSSTFSSHWPFRQKFQSAAADDKRWGRATALLKKLSAGSSSRIRIIRRHARYSCGLRVLATLDDVDILAREDVIQPLVSTLEAATTCEPCVVNAALALVTRLARVESSPLVPAALVAPLLPLLTNGELGQSASDALETFLGTEMESFGPTNGFGRMATTCSSNLEWM